MAGEMNALLELFLRMTIEIITMNVLLYNFCIYFGSNQRPT